MRPLSERVLECLPGLRVAWIAVWALVPWVNAGAHLLLGTKQTSEALWEQSSLLIVLNYAAVSFAVVITLEGTRRIAGRMEALRATTPNVLTWDASPPFRGVNSVAGPLLVTIAASVAFGTSTLIRDGWTPALLRGVTWLIIGIALGTFLWTYACLQLGLHRLGRERLVSDAVHVDPGLGLHALGRLASTGLWLLLVWLIPLLLTALPDLAGAVIGLLVLAAALGMFFFSLQRLHWQMVEVKAGELAIARELYTKAYEPVHETRTLEALEQRHTLLSAADALEKRASAIHEWPIDDGTLAQVITIATTVIAMMIGRLILHPLGL
ncbi:MAG TPA: hypothetical protein VFK76_11875 [Gaiellaceae bacterium]|nr:hypothetical protein [Gaiellaceae bacterium]